MSEGAAAPSGASASSAGTQAAAGNQSNQAGTQGQGAKGSEQSNAKGQAQAAQGKEQTPSQAQEEFEEIKLGSVSGRVPKALAQTIKQLQKGFTTSSQEAAAFRQILGNASPQQIAQLANDKERFAEYLFQRTGIDPDQYSQARLARMLEKQMMSPEQRKAAEQADKEREELAQLRREKAERDKEHQSAQERQMDQSLRNEIFTAWKDSGLPPDPEFGAWIAAEMARADAQKINLSAKEAASKIRTKFDALVRRIAPSLNPEQLEALLGSESLSKWREFDVSRITKQQAPQAGSPKAPRPPESSGASKPKKMMSEKEYREFWANKGKSTA